MPRPRQDTTRPRPRPRGTGASHERFEGAQQHLADAGEHRALLPLVDRKAAGGRQVVVEDLLHALGQLAGVELHAHLVVAAHGQVVDVGGADRGPVPVHGHRLGVDHGVLVEPDLHALAQQLPVVGARHPVRHDVVRVLGYEDTHAHSAPRGRDEGGEDLLVGDEVRGRDERPVGGPLQRVDVHAADRVEEPVGQVESGGDVGAPLARPAVGQGRRGAGPEVVPEVDEAVLQLPHRVARHPHVRVAPLVGEGVADVVAPDESDLPVDHQDLAVVLPGLADVEREEPAAQRREAPHVQVRDVGEAVEAGVLVEHAEAVPHAEHVDPAPRSGEQRLLEAGPPLVRAPDEGLEENVVLGAVDGLEHVVVQGGALRVGAGRRPPDPGVGGLQGGESVDAPGDALDAHPVDGVHGDDGGRLGEGDPHADAPEDPPCLLRELASL